MNNLENLRGKYTAEEFKFEPVTINITVFHSWSKSGVPTANWFTDLPIKILLRNREENFKKHLAMFWWSFRGKCESESFVNKSI